MEIGDNVICIDNSNLFALTIGKYYKIIALAGDKEIDKDSTMIWVRNDHNIPSKVKTKRFATLK